MRTDQETLDSVQNHPPDEIFSGIDIRVDGESVSSQLKGDNYVYGFVYEFFCSMLSSLDRLNDGHVHQFEMEYPFVLKFVPHGAKVEIYVHAPCVIEPADEEHYYADMNSFAFALIDAADEFLKFVREVRPEVSDHRALRELQEYMDESRKWYRETFGEEI